MMECCVPDPDPLVHYSIIPFTHSLTPVQFLNKAFFFNLIKHTHVDEFRWILLAGADRR